MSEYLQERQAKFIRYWEKKRENKRQMYLRNALVWGLVVSTLTYFFTLDFKVEDFEWLQFALRIVFWALGSLLLTRFQISANEKQYQRLKEE